MALIEFPKKKNKVYSSSAPAAIKPLAIEPEVVESLPPPQPAIEPVVQADNHSVPARHVRFYWVVMQIPTLILAIVVYFVLAEVFARIGESQAEFFAAVGAAMVAVVGLGVMTYITLLVASGDFTALREIRQRYRWQVQRDEMTVDYQTQKLRVIDRQNQMSHEEQMARIRADDRVRQLASDVKQLQYQLSMKQNIISAHVGELPDRQEQQRAAEAISGLPAKVDRYFFGLGGVYAADGTINPEAVESNGYFKGKVPWSSRGRGPAGWTPSDGQQFEQLMAELEGALGTPLVIRHETSRRWALNERDFPTRYEAKEALDRVLS